MRRRKWDNFQSHYTRDIVLGKHPHGGTESESLALFLSCFLAETRWYVHAHYKGKRRDRHCLFIFQPNGFLLLSDIFRHYCHEGLRHAWKQPI